jgi:hypothetical protein
MSDWSEQRGLTSASGERNGTVRIWNLKSGELVLRFRCEAVTVVASLAEKVSGTNSWKPRSREWWTGAAAVRIVA